MKRKLLATILTCAVSAALLTGCGGAKTDTAAADNAGQTETTETTETTEATEATEEEAPEAEASGVNEELSGTLTFTIWDNNLMDYIDQMDMEAMFQEKYPNANIEVEKIKDDTEYWNAMKMRASANQLPDVMFNKPFTLTRFKDYLLDLSDLEAYKNNELADGYKVDDKVLGIPMASGYEYVYYWKDMFEEAGVEVPTTWPEFEEVCLKLQEYYGKDNPDFMALACGLKDEWPDYPFMEFMPALISGNGQNWNTMATQDAPFAEGTDINTAYNKVNKLFNSGVLGKDPLGLGSDQVTTLFAQKKAAIIALGNWGLQNIKNGTEDISQLGTFYLPVRETEADPYNVIVQGDGFIGVTTHSKNPELAKAFVEWFASEDWYPGYVSFVSNESSMKTFKTEKDPVLAEADTLCPDRVMVMYDGGGDDFTAIQNEVAFDYKKLGAQMLTEGFDLTATLSDLDKKWEDAREKLGVQ